MISSEIEERIKQIEAAIEINESLDLNTEDLYRIKHDYEEQLKQENETRENVEESEEMSPFCRTTGNSISDCIEHCKAQTNLENNLNMGTCDGCEHKCQFIRDHKGSYLIHYPFLEVWVKCR